MGIYDAMNKGVLLSKGKWLYFLGADDTLFNETIFHTVFELNLPEKASILSGKVQYHKDDISFIYSKKKNVKTPSWNS